MPNDFKLETTPLLKIENFKRQHNLSAAYIKDESKNPFGTIKDRRSYFIVKEADRLKVDKLVLITSGNNGYSLAQFAKHTAVKVVCVVNKNIKSSIKEVLSKIAYDVIEINLDHKILRPEEVIAFAREREDEVIWEVTNGYEENYFVIVDEILKKISPDYIVVPLGSGGIFIGVVQGLERFKSKARVIGMGAQNTLHSIADKLSTPWTPYTKAIETYQKIGHFIYRLNEEEIKAAYKTFQHVVECEPSSSVVFAAMQKHKFNKDDTVVFINSGKSKF